MTVLYKGHFSVFLPINMKKIVWQTQSQEMYEIFNNNTLIQNTTGGNTYNLAVFTAINEIFNISPDPVVVLNKGENILKYWLRVSKHVADAPLVIKSPFVITLGKVHSAPVEIGMIHHLEENLKETSLKYRLFFKQLEKKVQQLDCVVTVSKYWEKRLQEIGCKNTKVFIILLI